MMRVRLVCALVVFAASACGARTPEVRPSPSASPSTRPTSSSRPFAEASAANTMPRPVPSSLITHGTRAADFAQQPVPPGAPLCAKEERRALTFEHAPTYTEKVALDGTFSARLFVGNPSACTRKISLPLSFTPPKSTTTRTIDFAAYVPPRGAFVDLALTPSELAETNVVPGRYAITFTVLDEDAKPVGRVLSGNPFRLGRDDVRIVTAPVLPTRIGLAEDLVVPLAIENVGDTANRVTPLVVFTRPGETAGIEHYEPPQLAVPGTSSYTLRLAPQAREAEKIAAGAWLVTITMFDAAGDRLNSFAGIPLTIGNIDIRMTRPTLPARVRSGEPVRATFKLENRGDTKEKITAIVAFTKPGTSTSAEFTFTREVAPGPLVFDAVVEPALRRERSVDKGVWLVSTAAFQSSGERIKSFTGHYLEITE
jgi:hypothetical protein